MSYIVTSTSAASDVATLLASLGYGTIGTDIFLWKEPGSHDGSRDNIITVYDTGASQNPHLGYTWEYPTVQVRVRRRKGGYQSGILLARTLMNAINGYVGAIGSVTYLLIQVVGDLVSLGEDERERPRWVFNLNLQRSG